MKILLTSFLNTGDSKYILRGELVKISSFGVDSMDCCLCLKVRLGVAKGLTIEKFLNY